MKILKIVLYASIAITYCWLTWWVLPDIAFVFLEEKGKTLPNSGLVMIGYDQSKITGHRVVVSIDSGWSALWAGWPCILVGALAGLGCGYVLGDGARRVFAVDKASKEAIDTAQEYETSATLKLAYCKSQEQKLKDGFAQLAAEHDALVGQRREMRNEKDLLGKKAKTSDSNELNKAKTTIQRLEKKIDKLKEKTVDG